MITGGVGQAVASPTDVVKVRLQADGRLKAVGKAPRYQVRETPSGAASQLGAWEAVLTALFQEWAE
jgi:hypothetical protein